MTKKLAWGFAKLTVMMAALLFLPAGTVHYWQGWAFLAAYLVPSAWISVYFLKHDPKLIERRLRAGAKAEGQPEQKRIMLVVQCLTPLLLVVPALDRRFAWSSVPDWLCVLGDALVVLGLIEIFFVFRKNSFTAATVQVETEQKVVTTGPYAYVRHPMYTGGLLCLLGMPFALASYWALLLFPPLLAVIVWRLIQEEKFLVANLEGYAQYRQQTRFRLLPGVY